MKKQDLVLLIFILSGISACTFSDTDQKDVIVSGITPVYGNARYLSNIEVGDTIEMKSPGKIVYKAPYLFVNEIDKGIHVINNSIPQNPIKESFIHIPFNKDLAVQGNIIYADNNNDLISLIYYSKDSIKLIDREENTFDKLPVFPADYFGYFECIDESKGTVIRWEETELINPECKIN